MKKKNCLTAKLRGRSGESIGEVLAALLISALALVMLASMAASSTNMVRDSENLMKTYIEGQNALARQSGTGIGGEKVTVKTGDGKGLYDQAKTEIAVEYYTNDTISGTSVISYKVK